MPSACYRVLWKDHNGYHYTDYTYNHDKAYMLASLRRSKSGVLFAIVQYEDGEGGWKNAAMRE